jgi:hypothetical protein
MRSITVGGGGHGLIELARIEHHRALAGGKPDAAVAPCAASTASIPPLSEKPSDPGPSP